MKEEIRKIITSFNSDLFIAKLEDSSSKHAYHGHGFKGESHFEIEIGVVNFSIMQKINLQKQITSLFSPLYSKEKVHSISVHIIDL